VGIGSILSEAVAVGLAPVPSTLAVPFMYGVRVMLADAKVVMLVVASDVRVILSLVAVTVSTTRSTVLVNVQVVRTEVMSSLLAPACATGTWAPAP